jgi:hypothetical protein
VIEAIRSAGQSNRNAINALSNDVTGEIAGQTADLKASNDLQTQSLTSSITDQTTALTSALDGQTENVTDAIGTQTGAITGALDSLGTSLAAAIASLSGDGDECVPTDTNDCEGEGEGEGDGDGNCPSHLGADTCSWLFGYASGESVPDSPTSDDVNRVIDVNDYATDFDSGLASTGSCPAPQQVDLGYFGSIQVEYAPMCDYASLIRYLVLMGAYASAAFLTFKGLV